MIGRYSHAHQFKRAGRELKFLRIRLGRVIRDIRRKIAGNETLQARFADLLALAVRVRFQDHRQRGPKVYALHAPEAECIGKGKARAPYEFGCKASIATPAAKPKGGMFVLLDVCGTGLAADDFARRLLESEGVAVLPCDGFGPSTEGHLRIALSAPEPRLRDAANRILRFVRELNRALIARRPLSKWAAQ
jgi:hypothetical protein